MKPDRAVLQVYLAIIGLRAELSDTLKIALMGPYPAQLCLRDDQIKENRRKRLPHPVPWIQALCLGLSARSDIMAKLFVHSRDVSRIRQGKVDKVECIFVPKIEPGNLDPVLGAWTARMALRSEVMAFEPDLVLGFGTESIYGLLASAFGRPSVVFIQGIVAKLPLASYGIPKWKHKFLRCMEKRALCRADAVIAENRFAAGWAESINPQLKIAVIPHAVQSKFMDLRSDYGKRILFVGEMNSNKRPDMVLAAFERICARHPDAELVLVGRTGDASAQLKRMLAEGGLSKQVRQTGILSRQELLHELSRARCLVVASKMDTSPNVITEAQAAGLPVIATSVGGIPEMIENGRDGYLVGADDMEAMADRMDELLSNQERAIKLGIAARQRVDKENRMQIVAERYLEFLRELVASLRK